MERSKLSNLLVRTLSGVVLVAVVVGAVLLSPYSAAALFLIITVGGMWEFYRFAAASGKQPQCVYGLIAGAALYTLGFLVTSGLIDARWFVLAIPAVMVVFIGEMYRRHSNPIANIGATLSGIMYVALPMTLLMAIATMGGGYRPWLILAIIFMVWANDVGAYLVGIAIGRHKMAEKISPKKTWEGFFGGVIFATAVGALMGHYMSDLVPMGIVLGALCGVLVSITGVLGDLVESMFKRSVGVKDSGAIIPGHGGWLDRFDALLMAVPFVFAFFAIFAL